MREELIIDGITHSFGDRLALDDVHFSVPPGRIVGLVGPNGAGKSTLMRIMFGVIEPDRGRVGWQTRAASAADRRSWGYMPQERGLYPDMRVRDQLVWLARLHGVTRSDALDRVGDLLDRLGLADRDLDTVKSLSGGMAQRVQLAASMVHQPQVLVLDEPFAGLDPTSVDFLTGVLDDHVERGGHLVFSSHQLDLVDELCESITLIDGGRVVLEGELRALRSASSERFLRVDAHVEASWLDATGAVLESTTASGSRIRLAAETDAAAVLDTIRAHVAVVDFAVESPSLSDLFRSATTSPRQSETAST